MGIEKKQLEKAARELVQHISTAHPHYDLPSRATAETPNTPLSYISDDTGKKCRELIDSMPLFSQKKPLHVGLVSAVLIILMTTGIFALPKIISYIRKSEDYGEYTEIRFRGTGTESKDITLSFSLTYVPDGYSIYRSTDSLVWYSDPNGDGEFMVDAKVIHSGPNSVSTLQIDTENAEREDITVHGNKGIILRKVVEYDQTDRLQIYWEDPQVGAYFLLTFSEMDESEAFKILNGFEYKVE